MDEGIVQQIVDELLTSLEPLEIQNTALLQFLKAKGLATDEELAPFLEQAGNTANVRWRAVRVRTAALISSAMKPGEKPAETTPAQSPQAAPQQPAEAPQEKPQKETAQKEEARTPDKEQASKKETEIAPPVAPTSESNSQPEKSNSASAPHESTKEKAA